LEILEFIPRSQKQGRPAKGGFFYAELCLKKWLLFGEAGAGERGVILYKVIASSRRRGIDPYAYLKDVLTRLPSMTNRQLVVLLPESWGRTHTHALRAAA
jgi:transposase